MHELILGGQRSGKSRCAEGRAQAWLAADPERSALLIATAQAGDDEMRARIARHRLDRAARLPAMATFEEPVALAQALQAHSRATRLIVVDCLTLWLTNLAMPAHGEPLDDAGLAKARDAVLDALRGVPGPVVLVSNEIGLGVAPLGPATRRFVDELGRLHQAVAEVCSRVTLLVAGIEVPVKGARR
ncbi:MAG TPA: bifunctional adenosylcobinamide kinase/adenosylcobinamide-phosphate guanylyltransferase [Burkholderiaceae bacterium]